MTEIAETAGFDFDEWIDGATVAEVSVDVFQQAGLLGKYDEWQRRYERAEKETAATSGERSAGEVDPLKALEEEGRQLLADLQENRVTWFLRALTSDDEIAVEAAHPAPQSPVKEWTEPAPLLPKNATEKQAEAFIAAFTSWRERRQAHESAQKSTPEYEAYVTEMIEVAAARGAERVHRAFVRIEKDGKVLTVAAPSVDQIRKLPAAIGEVQVGRLVEAVKAASEREPEVSGDFLHRTSTSDQD